MRLSISIEIGKRVQFFLKIVGRQKGSEATVSKVQYPLANY